MIVDVFDHPSAGASHHLSHIKKPLSLDTMPQHKKPHVRPIHTGASPICRTQVSPRRASRRTSTTLPSPLRSFISASDLTLTKTSALSAKEILSKAKARSQLPSHHQAPADRKKVHELFSPRELHTPRVVSLDETLWQSNHDTQAYKTGLWRRGSESFGKRDDADVFVHAMQAPPVPVKHITDPEYNKQSVRAVIHHSGERSPVGISRQFDINQLRATVPEATPSPKSEGFDKDAFLSAVIPDHTGLPSPIDERKKSYSAEKPVTPIHWQYARASLPVLASIMVSPHIQYQDTIDLPVPYPQAWPETVGFAYTGEQDLLSERVKVNIRHLGGNI